MSVGSLKYKLQHEILREIVIDSSAAVLLFSWTQKGCYEWRFAGERTQEVTLINNSYPDIFIWTFFNDLDIFASGKFSSSLRYLKALFLPWI